MARIQARNRSSHTYNAKTANEVANAILQSFVPEYATIQTQPPTLRGSAWCYFNASLAPAR